MKKFFLIPLLLMSSLYAYPRCSADLAQAVHTVYRFPEGKALIESVEAEGPISIYRAPFNSRSHAMWVSDDRAIVINANSRRPFGEVVRSIFFELHNAKANRQFEQLDWLAENRRISRDGYVEAVEKIEFENASQTSQLISKAIQTGHFPADAWWPIARDFETHFRIQKECGHSANIAYLYDSLSRSCYYGCRH